MSIVQAYFLPNPIYMILKKSFLKTGFIIAIMICFYNVHAQRKLPVELLNSLTKKIMILRESNQYFNSEILQVFVAKEWSYLETERQINILTNSFENQKMLFNYWYNKNQEKVLIGKDTWGCYELLFRYFKNTFEFDNLTSAYIAKYISSLDYLNSSEKIAVQNLENSRALNHNKEIELLNNPFDLKIIDYNQYEKYKDLIITEFYNEIFDKGRKKLHPKIRLDNQQLNINVIISIQLKRTYVLPASFPLEDWKSQPAKASIKTLSGTKYDDLWNLIPTYEYPITKYKNANVKTWAIYDSIKIKAARGYCKVEVKRRNITFTEYEPLNEDVKVQIIEKLKASKKGIYLINYCIGNIGDTAINEIIITCI